MGLFGTSSGGVVYYFFLLFFAFFELQNIGTVTTHRLTGKALKPTAVFVSFCLVFASFLLTVRLTDTEPAWLWFVQCYLTFKNECYRTCKLAAQSHWADRRIRNPVLYPVMTIGRHRGLEIPWAYRTATLPITIAAGRVSEGLKSILSDLVSRAVKATAKGRGALVSPNSALVGTSPSTWRQRPRLIWYPG